MGKFVFDAMRTLDFLATRADVDTARLGVIGNSLGGAIAAWLFALEPRLRLTIVSGWALSDALCRYSKHCTRVPNHKLRAVCDWPAFLRLGPGALLFANGDADVIIDHDLSGQVWRDTAAHLAAADPTGQRLRTWTCPGGGHRPYQGYRDALRVVQQHLGTPMLSAAALDALPELLYGDWCDRHGVALEKLYGVPLHYRGARLPDLGLTPVPREQLAVLQPSEMGGADFTIEGWLAAHGG
jgi:pimeloyl-ACP methyl ester carboxylesterase